LSRPEPATQPIAPRTPNEWENEMKREVLRRYEERMDGPDRYAGRYVDV
jgi:hypothetical protein